MREQTLEKIDQEDVAANAMDAPSTAPYRKGKSGMLRSCIEKLSLTHREIIEMFYYGEKSVAAISDMVAVPPAIVKSRIFDARRQLAKALVCAGSDTISSFRNPKTFAG